MREREGGDGRNGRETERERVSKQCSVVGVRERGRKGMGGDGRNGRETERGESECTVLGGGSERERGRGWEER